MHIALLGEDCQAELSGWGGKHGSQSFLVTGWALHVALAAEKATNEKGELFQR